MTYRGIHSTFPMNSTMNCKQGYLHIKRERNSSTVTTRVLFKPWQTAYFVLRKDPYILEEYKDASLKTQRQIHFIGTVKHVGLVRTSKSKQYAFEVVMQENTPLLLACENNLLRDEWISAFEQVMRDVNKIKEKSLKKNLARVEHIEDIHDVLVIPNSLSERNNLRGEYHMLLNSVRVILQNVDTKMEFLSWPLSHITYYKATPSEDKIVFVMSKHCHFGPGKLIFQTKDADYIVNFLDKYFNNNSPLSPVKMKTSNSFSDSSSNSDSSFMLSPNEIKARLHPRHVDDYISEQSRLSVSLYEKHSSVFDESEKISISIPNMSSPLSDSVDDDLDTHDFIHHYDGGMSSMKSEGDIHFGSIAKEESYIKPNEPEVNSQWNMQHTNFKRFSDRRTQLRNSGQTLPPADTDENCQTSYLQLNDTDSEADKDSDDYTKKILQSVQSSLQNPLHNDNEIANKLISNKSKSTSSPSPKLKKSKENRRQSEPANKNIKTTPSFDQELTKHKLYSEDRRKNSPLVTKASASKQNSFPKKHSISQRNNAASPFSIGETHFMSSPKGFYGKHNDNQTFKSRYGTNKKHFVSTIRRNPTDPVLQTIPTPELDRRLKPKSKQTLSKSSNENIEFFSPSKNVIDSPPPLPERYSPNQLLSPHKPLKRTNEIDFPENENPAENLNTSSILVKDTLLPPPVPPKANLLSSTKSAPLSNSFDTSPEEELRRASFSDVPVCIASTDMANPREKISKSNVENAPAASKKGITPENLPKLSVLSSSENNLLEETASDSTVRVHGTRSSGGGDQNADMTLALRKSLPSNLNHSLAHSLDSTQFKKLLQYPKNENTLVRKPRGLTETDVEVLFTNQSTKNSTIPRKLFSKNSDFPKSPKTFY